MLRSRPHSLEEVAADFQFLDENGRPTDEPFRGELRLRPGERRQLLLGGQLREPLGPGEFAAIEVTQSCEEQLVGSLGLALVGEGDQ